jgi:hypothetical protein
MQTHDPGRRQPMCALREQDVPYPPDILEAARPDQPPPGVLVVLGVIAAALVVALILSIIATAVAKGCR